MLNTARWLTFSCVLLLAAAPSAAQDPTATITRRSTPTSTPTRTRTPTPTVPTGGETLFLCSAGPNDGASCETDAACPHGACVLTQGVCDGGSRDSEFCSTASECEGAPCLASHRVCRDGDARGNSCLRDSHCTGSQCVSTGLFCNGGDLDLFSCIDDGGCIGVVESGLCVAPTQFACTGGPNDAADCRSHLDCPAGACVIAQKICQGGGSSGELLDCESSFDCPNGPCVATHRVCNAGVNKGFGCLGSQDCPGATCVSPGLFCDGGAFELISCVDDASCSPPGEDPAECVVPGPNFYCSGGPEDGGPCGDDSDCPSGVCVFSQGVCSGGDSDGFFCLSNADCGGFLCLQTQRVCLAGESEGLACSENRHCGSGVICGSSGLICVSGGFEDLSCVTDVNCCDAPDPAKGETEDCEADDPDDGFCLAPAVLLCSAGPSDNLECESHFDCPSGACVIAQGICDGGSNESNDCQADVNCPGGTCVETSHLCTSGEGESFGCLDDGDCFDAGPGVCQATGQFCDGGDTDDPDYDPFAVDFSCTDSSFCSEDFACSTPFEPGLVCSAGARDAQPCASNDECSGGVCVLQDALCAGGGRDAALCDSSADCPGGGCNLTHRVCSSSGFSCVNAGQCESGEQCFSSGRQCLFTSFGSVSCVNDGNCYEGDPNAEVGACAPLSSRACRIDAPCRLEYSAVEEVYGAAVDPAASPATFDFYTSPIPAGAAAVVVVLRAVGGDADLYLGPEVSDQLTSMEAYPFASNNIEDTDDTLRVSPLSTPKTFVELAGGLDDLAVVVAGAGTSKEDNLGPAVFSLEAVFLGDGPGGDADCDGEASAQDVEGLLEVIFDPATRLTPAGTAIGRCLGGDGNDDDRENAADVVAAIRFLAQP